MSLPEDFDSVDPGFFSPGMADPESADSMGLWQQGFLEDPLGEDDK
jgi:hypothetical protein